MAKKAFLKCNSIIVFILQQTYLTRKWSNCMSLKMQIFGKRLIFKWIQETYIYAWQTALVLFFDIKHLFLIRILLSHFLNKCVPSDRNAKQIFNKFLKNQEDLYIHFYLKQIYSLTFLRPTQGNNTFITLYQNWLLYLFWLLVFQR